MKTSMLNLTPVHPGTCEWCGKLCELEDSACSLACEAKVNQLDAVQGRAVLRALKLWRKHRGRKGTPGEGKMTDVANMIDGFLKNDRKRRLFLTNQRAEAEAKAAETPAPPLPDRAKKGPEK